MRRILLLMLALGLVVATNGATWANTAMKACPGKCPFCP